MHRHGHKNATCSYLWGEGNNRNSSGIISITPHISSMQGQNLLVASSLRHTACKPVPYYLNLSNLSLPFQVCYMHLSGRSYAIHIKIMPSNYKLKHKGVAMANKKISSKICYTFFYENNKYLYFWRNTFHFFFFKVIPPCFCFYVRNTM